MESLTIGRPLYGPPKHLNEIQVRHLFNTLRDDGWCVDENDLFGPYGGSVVASQRNRVVDNFLKTKNEYLLWIDSDQCFSGAYNMVMAFDQLASHGKDIIGATYPKRFPPYNPCMAKIVNGRLEPMVRWPEEDLFTVDSLGMGFMLVKRIVVERMKLPAFQTPVNGIELEGEDGFFCRKAKELGFDTWVDPSIPLKHIGDFPIGFDNFYSGME